MAARNKGRKKGKVTIYLLILVVILGSILFAQGIFPKSTITPSLEDSESILATQTPGPERGNLQLDTLKFIKCGETVAVDFLVDNSGSMRFGNKMANLKSALTTFASTFPPYGIVGMQSFSDWEKEDVTFGYFKDKKQEFLRAISLMQPDSATHTKDAFILTSTLLPSAMARYPKQKFNLIFISDGVPETGRQDDLCPGGPGTDSEYCTARRDVIPSPGSQPLCRCFDPSQDPTQIATDIKSKDVRIFSIGYISDEDDKFKEKLRTLMKNVASSPEDFYEAPITNQITAIIKQITTKICKE